MFEPKQNKSDISVSFYVNGDLRHEYIPAVNSKIEEFFHIKFRQILDYANAPNYYWHYRYLLDPINRKIEDLKFMIHVYEKHDGEPDDKYERRHYRHVCNLYADEFVTFIAPKLNAENLGRGISHHYAVAYYKKWLKPINPNFTRLYHGVDNYEMLEMFNVLLDNLNSEYKKQLFREKYHDRLVKQKSIKMPKSSKKLRNQAELEKQQLKVDRLKAYKDFKIIFGAIDITYCFMVLVYMFGGDGVDKPFWDNIYTIIGVTVLWQLFFVPVFYIIKFFRFQDIK